METIGVVGVGLIGMPIAENLIKSGRRVVGYRRSSLAAFENIGGVPARSPAEVGAQADVVFSCVPSSEQESWTMCSKSTPCWSATEAMQSLSQFELRKLGVMMENFIGNTLQS